MQANRVMFSERQPDYRYMPTSNEKADVFIYKFIEESKSEEDESTSFIYDMNEFKVNTEEITEDMIKEDPLSWINYNPNIEDISLASRIEALEDAMLEMGEMIYND